LYGERILGRNLDRLNAPRIKEQHNMQKQLLERRVEETAGAVAHWQQNKARIETQIADATARRAKAATLRKAVALDASLGNPKAIADLAQARAEHAAATGDLADLSNALDDAAPKLADAEAAAASAHRALTKHHAEIRMRRRIGRAARVDAAIAALAAELQEFDADGADIANTPDTLPAANMFGTSSIGRLDEITGNRRLRAALAAAMGTRLEKVFPNANYDEKRPETLTSSEARIWNLPPENADVDKAA
jgi:chromosome segregation ATPase